MAEQFVRTLELRKKKDAPSRIVEFVASDESVDSYGTVIRQAGWDLSRFQKNPVIGYNHNLHNSNNPDDIIGKGEVFVEDNQLIVRVEFEPESINELAEKVYQKVMFGTLNSVSVGFNAIEGHWGEAAKGEDKDVYYFDRSELLEISIVNIPANPNANKRSDEQEQRSALPPKPQPQAEVTDKLELTVAAALAALKLK